MKDSEVVGRHAERRSKRSWLEQPRLSVVVYVLAFVVAELLGAYVDVGAQAIVDAAFAFIAINHTVFGYRTQRTAGLVMATLFGARMMVITIPATGVALTTRAGVVAIPTIVVAYVASYVLKRDISGGRLNEGFDLKKPIISKSFTAAITVLSGFIAGALAYAALHPTALVQKPLFGSVGASVTVAAIGLGLGALSEELLYRRMVSAMVQHTALTQAPWISGILFAAAYLGTRSPAMVAIAFVFGSFWAWSCEHTGSIKPVVAAHLIASLMTFLVLSA